MRVFVVGEAVRMELTEDVTNTTARYCLESATTLPNAETLLREDKIVQLLKTVKSQPYHLQILSTPAIHLFIITTDLPKVVARNCKQATSHCGAICRTYFNLVFAVTFLSLSFSFRHVMPVEMSVPGKAADLIKRKFQYLLSKNTSAREITSKPYPSVWYSKVFEEITSIRGTTTEADDSWILLSKGGSQPWAHSQWASRKIITSPCAILAPAKRAWISPDL